MGDEDEVEVNDAEQVAELDEVGVPEDVITDVPLDPDYQVPDQAEQDQHDGAVELEEPGSWSP